MKFDPVQKRELGIFALLLSLVFIVIAGGVGATNAFRRDSVSNQVANANQECQNKLGALGVTNPTVGEEEIVATWPGVEGGWESLSSASTAALVCPGWQMRNACMGQGCPTPGMSVTLGRATS